MTDYADLIRRLETAEEGSEDLDWKILGLLGNPLLDIHTCPPQFWRHVGSMKVAPIPFTTSIDAALTLVPEGWTVARISQDDRKLWHVELREGYATSYNRVIIVPDGLRGTIPPLALCIAALKARQAAMEQADEQPA